MNNEVRYMKFINSDGSSIPSNNSAVTHNDNMHSVQSNGVEYLIDHRMQFPLININLLAGHSVYIQPGSMVYHDTGIELSAHLNGRGRGAFKLFSALGRSLTSGESSLITQAIARSNGTIALAPEVPGDIKELKLGQYQYKINDGKFLAMDGNCSYKMERQAVGHALFSGNGGFYIMTTEGTGSVIVNSYGSIRKIELNNGAITIDNYHVVAWSTNLDYDLHMENGFWQSMGTGEGLVNTFKGTGEVYIQSLNLDSLAQNLIPLLPFNRD